MTRRYAHIIPIFLMALTMLPLLAAGILHVHLWITRYRMLERLEDESVIEITLHKDDIRWHERGRELLVKSNLFDVKSIHPAGDSVVFRGLFDEVETSIKGTINNIIENHPDRSKNSRLLSRIFHQMTWEDHAQSFSVGTIWDLLYPDYPDASSPLPLIPYLGLNSPPPDQC